MVKSDALTTFNILSVENIHRMLFIIILVKFRLKKTNIRKASILQK